MSVNEPSEEEEEDDIDLDIDYDGLIAADVDPVPEKGKPGASLLPISHSAHNMIMKQKKDKELSPFAMSTPNFRRSVDTA